MLKDIIKQTDILLKMKTTKYYLVSQSSKIYSMSMLMIKIIKSTCYNINTSWKMKENGLSFINLILRYNTKFLVILNLQAIKMLLWILGAIFK